ncbi:MAG: 3-alpha domain-containing protein [bacterium]
MTVRELLELHQTNDPDQNLLLKVLQIEGLSESWRESLERKAVDR